MCLDPLLVLWHRVIEGSTHTQTVPTTTSISTGLGLGLTYTGNTEHIGQGGAHIINQSINILLVNAFEV